MPEMEGSMAAGELQEAFSIFDTKGDGCIHAHQLGEVLRALGKNPTEADIKKFGYAQRPGKLSRQKPGLHLEDVRAVGLVPNYRRHSGRWLGECRVFSVQTPYTSPLCAKSV